MTQDQNLQGNVDPLEVQSEKIDCGAPDGPGQKRRKKHDRRSPLDCLGHEAIAQFLAAPKSLREFKSVTALAQHFHVTRMTVYRWAQDIDVLRRAEWLSMRCKVFGDLVPRREWQRIMETAIEMAISGDVRAMKFCADRAWPEDRQPEGSRMSTMTLEEIADSDDTFPLPPPSWVREQMLDPETREREAEERRLRDLACGPIE